MPERQSLRFIVRPGAVQHQNGARAAVVVRGLHIFVAQVRGAVVNLPNQRFLRVAIKPVIEGDTFTRDYSI